MVAECSSALTGVGPSIASGSHVSSGNCALLPTMPPKIRSAASVTVAGARRPAAGPLSSRMSRPPNCVRTSRTPRKKATSPKRVITKAFLPASLALNFSYQNPIRR